MILPCSEDRMTYGIEKILGPAYFEILTFARLFNLICMWLATCSCEIRLCGIAALSQEFAFGGDKA